MESVCTFHIKTMKAKDFPFAVHLSNTMNWNATTADFQLAVKLEPNGCFVLMDDQNRVGIATTVSYGKVGWFGNLVVSEEYRNKGAGSLLTEHGLSYLRSRNVDTIGLYAYAHLTHFYEHFGFKKDENYSMLKGKPLFHKEMRPVEKIQQKDAPSVIALDGYCFGGDRSRLLSQLLNGKPNICYSITNESGIKGYIASNGYRRTATVGPMVVVSDKVDYAEALLANVLNKLIGFQVFTCVPTKERALLNLLFSSGFQEDFQVIRMFSDSKPAPKCIYLPESLERG